MNSKHQCMFFSFLQLLNCSINHINFFFHFFLNRQTMFSKTGCPSNCSSLFHYDSFFFFPKCIILPISVLNFLFLYMQTFQYHFFIRKCDKNPSFLFNLMFQTCSILLSSCFHLSFNKFVTKSNSDDLICCHDKVSSHSTLRINDRISSYFVFF